MMFIYRLKKAIFVLVPLLLLGALRLQLFLPADGDKGWLLHATQKWLEGRNLYTTIFEVNPPLIFCIYAVPVWLSMHLKWLTDYEALAGLGVLMSVFSSWIGTKLIALHPAFENNKPGQLKFLFLQLLIFIFFTTQAYFFDREHIFIVLGFPYIIRFMPQLAERKIPVWLTIVTGLMGAVAFCIKPHCMLIFATLQLFALIRTRSWKSLYVSENLIIAGFTAFYVLLIALLTPDYFRYVVPMASQTYWTFRNEHAYYVFLPPFLIAFALLFADYRPRHQTPYRRDVLYLAGLCIAFVVYSSINNGWGYTYNPLYCLLMLTAGWMLWDYDWLRQEYERDGIAPRNVVFGLRGCFIVFLAHACYMLFYFSWLNLNLDRMRQPCSMDPECYRSSHYLSYFYDHDVQTFGTLSFDFSNWVTLKRMSGADWVTRFNHLWMLPKLMFEGEPYTQQHFWIIEFVAKGLADDMNTRKPEVMMIDSSPGLMGIEHAYNLKEYLSVVPEFKEAFKHYRYELSFNGCGEKYTKTASECRYDLYKRIP